MVTPLRILQPASFPAAAMTPIPPPVLQRPEDANHTAEKDIARRREALSAADASAALAGLPPPGPKSHGIGELWVRGQITVEQAVALAIVAEKTEA